MLGRLRTWLRTDRGQSQLAEGLLFLSITLLVGAIIATISNVDMPLVPPTMLFGTVTAACALVFSLMVADHELLKAASAFVLACQLAFSGALFFGVIPIAAPDTPTSMPTPVFAATPSPTLSRTAPLVGEVSPTPQTSPTPSPTLPMAGEPTATITTVTQPPMSGAEVLPTVTAAPFTVTPTPQSYDSIRLVAPAAEHSFSSAETPVLEWQPVENLQFGDHYLVHLKHRCGENYLVTDDNSWNDIDPGFRDCTPQNDQEPWDGIFRWWVAVCRGADTGSYSNDQFCDLPSSRSEERRFTWATPNPPEPPSVITPES